MGLYYLTEMGKHIRFGQYVFIGFYIINLLLVFNIYRKVKKVSSQGPFPVSDFITVSSTHLCS